VEGDIDPTDFLIGEALGKTVGEVRAMPNAEVVEWVAFWVYRKAMAEVDG
jgi:hypothetical protein